MLLVQRGLCALVVHLFRFDLEGASTVVRVSQFKVVEGTFWVLVALKNAWSSSAVHPRNCDLVDASSGHGVQTKRS